MKNILFIILMAISSITAFAQDEEPRRGFDKSRLFFGGNFGLSFGNYTFVNVSPQVGYRFNNWFAAGAGPNFQYTSYKNRINGNTISREKLWGAWSECIWKNLSARPGIYPGSA